MFGMLFRAKIKETLKKLKEQSLEMVFDTFVCFSKFIPFRLTNRAPNKLVS